MLLKYVVTTMVDDSFIFSVMYSNLSFLAQPSNNARLLKDDLLNGEPIPSCQTKYNDDNNDDDVNEFNNDYTLFFFKKKRVYVEVQHNNSKDTNTNAEASEETC